MARRAKPLDLTVDREGDLPLGTQLAWKLRAYIAAGVLAPGDRLPGVRELAEAARVNVNTARAVYARLEEQDLIASEHGRGTFVAPGGAAGDDLARAVAAAAAAAREAGLDPRDVASALFSGADLSFTPADDSSPAPREEGPREPQTGGAESESGRAETRGAKPGGATERRALRAEIAELERELVHLDRGAELADRPRPAAGRILTAAELRVTRDDLIERIADLRDERSEHLRRAAAERAARLSPTPAPARTWRPAGVWTGKARPGVVWTGS